MSLFSFIGGLLGRLGLGQNRMAEAKLDLQELDRILKKNTSELPNPLQGVSFSVFNNKGTFCISLSTASKICYDYI